MRRLLLVSLLIISNIVLSNERYYFSNLSLGDGLSQITVVCIHQDKSGSMWFGTRNGLNRYDGYTFDTYFTRTEDNASISDNHILCITEDKDGTLWIGTNNGLNKLDLSTNKFTRYFHEKDNDYSLMHSTILSIYFDKDNNLWVGTNDGLCLYNRETDSFKRISIGNLSLIDRINAIARQGDELYLGTLGEGLVVYNIKNETYKVYKNKPGDPNSIPHDYVRAVFIDHDENLWIGTRHGGVGLRKKGEDAFRVFNQNNGLTNNYVRSITEAPDGSILIGTYNGLNVIDTKTWSIEQYKKYGSGQGNLSHYSIIYTYFDRANTLWVGTYAGGVCYYNRYGQKFQFYSPNNNQENILGIVGPMIDHNNKLYIATEGGGLLVMDKSAETFRRYKMYEGNVDEYGKNTIKSLCLDGNRILCGTNIGTIHSFDINAERFSLLYDLKNERSIYYIGRARNKNLIIGSVSNEGLLSISPDGVIKRTITVDGKEVAIGDVRCAYELKDGVFLVGTRNDGLFYYDSQKQILKVYKNDPANNNPDKIPENYVSNIFEDSMGNIWIGTFGGGLAIFDPQNEKFTTYSKKNGLSDDNICAIVEDNNRHLWISTISGISDFDMEMKSFVNYTHSNGIKIDEFTPHAGIRLKNENIIFSGNNGFVLFNPQRMSVNPYIPPVILKNLFINNDLILPEGRDGILGEQLSNQEKIVLEYNQSNIAIEYSALNYVFSDKNQYAYMLEGFDKEWNEVGNRRVAYYTNVPPGNYKFIVRGSNNDGTWNNDGASIMIEILPPFWKTWWAYCLYFILISGILFFIYRYFNEKKRLQNDIRMKQIETKTQREFHEARNKLFTNFSHELRTPLTLIMSPIEDLIDKETLTQKGKHNLLLMRNNAKRLLRLVNNLMDFQKKESGTMVLKVSQGDFVQFTEEMVSSFEELACSRYIELKFDHSVDSVESWYDKSMMEKVFFNFLSNALKNVPNGGAISVSLRSESLDRLRNLYPERTIMFNKSEIDYLILDIKDSGVGIPKDQLEDIFIPFYQVAQNEHSASGTGLGLSLSKSIIEMHHGVIWAESPDGEGALFRCILPVDKSCFSASEIVDEDKYEGSLLNKIEIPEESVADKNSKKKNYSVLVVEDNTELRNYIVSHLAEIYNVMEASNGEDGITKAINTLPDLIISDLMMPKMDGMEMCSKIKNDIRTSHIPVIMLTARSMASDIKEGYETGADDYITKPFDSSLLMVRVSNIIQARAKLKDIYGKRFSLESLGVEAVSVDEQFMQKLYTILENNISNPEFDLDSFCQEIGMSRTNLYRKIKSVTGLSPNEYLRNFRLTMGAKMLKEAKLPVSEVYVAVGFNSHAYFSNCFKTHFGVSPTEYVNNPPKNEE
ncbi:signal transduction histidine kinase/ligand-binding sensor domain-containing protein/DNA-binding response OmpR family regulator [Dysgonomonas sp. PFB1-18]|uniref:hybrid sensor histidine kinase/response regulator n=1 Tax=unclassified Dysgonomonas TaxID=2630389 RepID=UPI00247693AF|nr:MULTISPECIES: hybrid sensor histidine kinase/response regulator transcription factor [unclassified Dysgonomonas]MDH6310976.1 signal transduction histidine kinase/ligand-binding sensor domain-containing protein/DNA-binding response OmpR family regulator [Dysgonomonas sp. PF1-14]MDH6340809.1 signal transduction histidine kinase/ligand-binding sensor domain-containing protein/DNA-binding response OmpR family regulator [Dysgonomonas sp. PF1-16]MDH6382405.1 signal transduction histidine kinase/lig